MLSPDARFSLVYNGEIYNYQELRRELEQQGVVFRGTSDTEVLLHGVQRWGVERTLPKLNGMFAFAVWDEKLRKLWLARDRFGEKPLYYTHVNGICIFASELKALVCHSSCVKEIDRRSLSLYMRFSYVPAPYSIYRNVKKLCAGTYVCVDCEAGIDVQAPVQYWTLADVIANRTVVQLAPNDPAIVDYVEQCARRAIRLRMVADVPLGAFLSGGIDSSTIVALMQAQSTSKIRTFTVGFEEATYNEAGEALRVARHLGTEHRELYVTAKQCVDVIAQLPAIYDEPFADSSQIPTLLVSRFARHDVTVALSGDAGDEFWGGYDRYFWTQRLWPYLGQIPQSGRRIMADAIRTRPPKDWEKLLDRVQRFVPSKLRVRNGGEKLHKLSHSIAARSLRELYTGFVSQWHSPEAVLLDCNEPTHLADVWNNAPSGLGHVEQMMYADAMTYMSDDILCKVDRAAMSVGLETRVPFLDNDLVALSWNLPLRTKIHDGVGKWPLRQILRRYIPPELFERPKAGFGVPIGDWLRGDLREWAKDTLNSSRLRQEGFFEPAIVSRLLHEHLSGRCNAQHTLWSVLMFEGWFTAVHRSCSAQMQVRV